MTYTAVGKQVLRDAEHIADAATPAYATAIAAAMNVTSVDRGTSSPVMREVREQSLDVYDTQSPDTLRTLRGDEGRLDIFRGMQRLGYIDAEDRLWLLDNEGYAEQVDEDVDRSQVATLIARHGV